MAGGHFHRCEQCDKQYVCTAPLERNDDGWPDPVCVTRKETDRMFHLCVDCAEAEPTTEYEAIAYDRLRAVDERRPSLSRDTRESIARRVKSRAQVTADEVWERH